MAINHNSTAQLRPIAFDDLELVLSWRNSDRIKAASKNQDVISWDQHVNWFQQLSVRDDRVCFIFEVNNQPVGLVQFFNISRDKKESYWGFYIGDESNRPGLGSLMCSHALDWAFHTQNLKLVRGETLDNNDRSKRFHEKLGFRLVKDNPVTYEISKSDWELTRAKLKEAVA